MRVLIASLLLLKSSIAFAITIDVPGYDFAALAGTMSTSAILNDNLMDPVLAITDDKTSTYVFSHDNPASIDVTFNDGIIDGVAIANGQGVDMSVFFVSSGGHEISLTLFDDLSVLGTHTFNNVAYTGFCIDDGSGSCEAGSATDLPIFVMNIDFAAFGNLITVADSARLDISGASAVPSLIGAYHLASTVTLVPVPPAVLLFTSGLGLLGFLSRRRYS